MNSETGLRWKQGKAPSIAHRSRMWLHSESEPGIWRTFLGDVLVLASPWMWLGGSPAVPQEGCSVKHALEGRPMLDKLPADGQLIQERGECWLASGPPMRRFCKSVVVGGKMNGAWRKECGSGEISGLLNDYLQTELTNNIDSYWTVISAIPQIPLWIEMQESPSQS